MPPLSDAPHAASVCPFCGEPQADHVFASQTSCVIDSTFSVAGHDAEWFDRQFRMYGLGASGLRDAVLVVVDQRDRYREALEEIARDVFSDRSLSAMKCAYIARDALAVSRSPAKESL